MPNSFLPLSLIPSKTLPDSILAKWLFSAPTFSEIDISLSFRIINISSLISPAWFKASNAIPAVIAPSPITATVLRFLFSFLADTDKPSAADIEVLE